MSTFRATPDHLRSWAESTSGTLAGSSFYQSAVTPDLAGVGETAVTLDEKDVSTGRTVAAEVITVSKPVFTLSQIMTQLTTLGVMATQTHGAGPE